jgi:hypothetical protein
VTSADYRSWDRAEPLTTGCAYGGSISYQPGRGETRVRLRDCAWSEGLALTGVGSIKERTGAVRLSVADGTRAFVSYTRDAAGSITVDGQLGLFAARRAED